MIMTKKQKWSIRFLKVLFLIISFAILFNMMQPDTPETKAIKQQLIDEKKVRVACIIGIKKTLSHPGSMEIINRSVSKISNNEWVASIGIKTLNDYNVLVPLRFTCQVHRDNAGEYQLTTFWVK